MEFQKLLLRMGEAADALGCSRAKAYDLANRNLIPTVRIDRMLRVPADALQEWVAKQAKAAE